jgi:ATP-dependent exoDNAse (exonuclease V) alpha subunit
VTTILENPYVLSERYIPNAWEEPIDFNVIDHALLPHDVMGRAPTKRLTPRDPRRFRALAVDVLRRAAAEGHTFLDIQKVRDGVMVLSEEHKACDIPLERFTHRNIIEALAGTIEVFDDSGLTFYALSDLQRDEIAIRDVLLEMIARDRIAMPDRITWQSFLARKGSDNDDQPLTLSQEQIAALDRCYTNPISVITGAAGTGKSSLLAPLIAGIRAEEGRVRVLALAPTGKAAERLRQLDVEAMTIHRALTGAGWYDWDLKKLKRKGADKIAANTIVIDEASMVDIELFATLVRAVEWSGVVRLVLVGDYYQLPPIGPGRPFYDFVSELQIHEDKHRQNKPEDRPDERFLDRLSELQENHRVAAGSRAAALANSYARLPEADEPEIFAAIARGQDIGDLKVRFWDTAETLHALVLQEIGDLMSADPGMPADSREAFNVSIGHDDTTCLSYWQLLTPVRGETYGTRKLNAIIQDKYHGGLKVTTRSRYGVKFGDERITLMDKVMQVMNEKRRIVGTQQEEQLYNGQLGIVKAAFPPANRQMNDGRGRPKYINVEFDGREGLQFKYSSTGLTHGVNGRLELAYAISVHKSQGSQFKHVFLVIPKEQTRHLSRELLYTGLTRGRTSLTLFIEGDVQRLLQLRRPKEAEAPKRNSQLFHVRAGDSGRARSDGHVHVTTGGDYVLSKSEVIVANLLQKYKESHGLNYTYEQELMPTGDPTDMRLPDFTITYKGKTFYWEHCGMVDDSSYLHKWETVRHPWYARHKLDAQLIVSYDKPGGIINSWEIEQLISARIIGQP